MKTLAIPLCLLLAMTGLAHAEPTKKANRESGKDGRPAQRKSAPKERDDDSHATKARRTPPKNKETAGEDESLPAKSKSAFPAQKPTAKSDSEVTEALTEGPLPSGIKREAAVSTIAPEELADFDSYAPQIQQLVRSALDLTKLNLTYTFGSADPAQGGMDCSGTIVYLLNSLGMKGVPRQSDEICGWVQDRTLLHRITLAADSLKHPEFSALQPGDLLFWSGTYVTAPRKIPVTHVMIYLGKLKKTGRHIVFGASDGRVYQGERRTGVSVFDLSLPRLGSPSSIYGYGLIPAIGKIAVKTPVAPELTGTPAASATPGPEGPSSGQPKVKGDVAALAKVTYDKNDAVSPPLKPTLGAQKTAAAAKLETDTGSTAKEEVRRAIPSSPATDISDSAKSDEALAQASEAPSKSATKADDMPPKSKVKVKVKSTASETARPKPKVSATKSSTKRRSPPRELTPGEKISDAANRITGSIRNAFGN